MRNNMLMNTKRGWTYIQGSVLRMAKRVEAEENNYCIREEKPR